MLRALSLLSLLCGSPAQAGEAHELTYRLVLDGEQVGERTLTVRYLDDDVRLLEAETRLGLSLGRQVVDFEQRLAGRGRRSTGGFVASNRESAVRSQVQLVEHEEGWTRVTIDPWGEAVDELPWAAFDETSLSLMDPGVTRRFQGLTTLRVLSAETGEVLSGPLEEVGTKTIDVDGTPTEATAYVWQPQGLGNLTLVYGARGHLLAWSWNWFGVLVKGQITSGLPPERSWGETIEGGSLIGPSLSSEEL